MAPAGQELPFDIVPQRTIHYDTSFNVATAAQAKEDLAVIDEDVVHSRSVSR
jgi:hypothetical protein